MSYLKGRSIEGPNFGGLESAKFHENLSGFLFWHGMTYIIGYHCSIGHYIQYMFTV